MRTEAGYTTDLWTRQGDRVHRAKPGPAVLPVPRLQRSLRARSAACRSLRAIAMRSTTADQHFSSFPRDAMHPWQFHNKAFHNSQVATERVAAETSGVDDGVGEIMATLERLGLDDRTLVVYAADQGWMGGQNGIWGMGDHTRPIGAHELMMQIPLIFRQPGHIPAGKTSDLLVSNYDFLPSLLGHLGLGDMLPQQPKSPGRDFSPVLRGHETAWDNAVFYEMETCRAVRTDRWKLVLRHPDGPHEFYDDADRPARTLQSLRPARHRGGESRAAGASGGFLSPIRRPPVRPLEERTLQSQTSDGSAPANDGLSL